MDVMLEKQNFVENEEILISYPKNKKHIYDMKDETEHVMNIIDINGIEYERDGEVCLSRREKSAGYKVALHFSNRQNDVAPIVQMLLTDAFVKNFKQDSDSYMGENRHEEKARSLFVQG